ncbi:MAG: Gfo/Idh/MocA family oxidoreductase, partial [Nitrospirota bacterium]|nr:Gfo/Idh/MocA family oxidoreductase [Nitrospirota bacterium]
TVTLDEADDLIREAKKGKLILQIGHIERFNGAVQTLLKLIKEPLFIESHRLGPFPERSTDVDVVLDLMIHDIDIILSLVGTAVKRISAVGVPVITPKIDIANARIEFKGGCVADVTASRVSPEKQRKLRIFQHDTYISLDYGKQEISVFKREMVKKGKESASQIAHQILPVEREEPLKAQLEAFVESVRTRKKPAVSGEEGREALKVALQVLGRLKTR